MEITSLARRALAQVTPYAPGKPVEELEREQGIARAIKLASNENPLGPSPKALQAIARALPQLHRYPDGHCFYLVRKLSERWGVPPEMIIVGNGSDEIITFATRAFLEPRDEVVVATPTFLIYRLAAQIAGARVRAVPLSGFRYDLAAMARAVTPRTKLLFIANPDNPTGSYVTRPEVEKLLGELPGRVIVFFDEAYAEWVEAPDYPDTRRYLTGRPMILTRTFSKAYGLSGLRVGYGLAPAPLCAAMQRVREPFNVNALAQVGALAALEDAEHLEKSRALVWEEKGFLYEGLRALGLTAVPSAANFILFHIGPRAAEVTERLLGRGIIVRHLKAWDLPEHLRVTIGRHEENVAFLAALKEALK